MHEDIRREDRDGIITVTFTRHLKRNALTVAMRSGEVSVVTPFRYTRLVFALILAVLVFGERPDPSMLLGSALIVGSGLFTLARSRR